MDLDQPQDRAAVGGADDLLPIGHIVGTHGVRGELKLRPFNPDSDSLLPGIRLVLRREKIAAEHSVATVRPHKRCLLVTLRGCESMTAAQAWIGWEACLHKEDLPEVGPDEVYHHELLGMDMVTTSGEALGKIVDILSTAAHDIGTVRGRGREYLIPLIGEVVKSIDKEGRRVVIDPIPGLLDP